jgi:hypothetical protein
MYIKLEIPYEYIMVYAIKTLGEVGRENQKHEENKNSSNILNNIKAIRGKKEKYRGIS